MPDESSRFGNDFPSRKHLGIIAFVFALIFSCVLMFLPPGIERHLTGCVQLLTAPSQAIAALCARATRGILGGLPDTKSREDFLTLQAEAAEYETAFANLQAESATLEQENALLRNRLALISNSSNLSLTLCEVVKRDPFSEYYDTIMINKGSGDGIKPGYCVMNERGLVGIVQWCSFSSSQVRLATSRQFSMPCQVRSRNVTALLMGSGTENPKELSMVQPVPKIIANGVDGILFDKVAVGDVVTVSATGESNGHGIVVGTVGEVKGTMAGAPILTIQPAASFTQLKYLFVVVGKESGRTK